MLRLLPNTFSEEQSSFLLLPEGLSTVVSDLDCLIAESERSGRRYLLRFHKDREMARHIPIRILNEHTDRAELEEIVSAVISGGNFGLISDGGLPVIADPGSDLVAALRKKGFERIQSFPGPSAIIIGLQVSGLSGQKFFFHGYLPREGILRQKELLLLESQSGVTHICIETPYRNQVFFDDCINVLREKTMLTVASMLTFPNQVVKTCPVVEWKKKKHILEKQTTVFLIRHE